MNWLTSSIVDKSKYVVDPRVYILLQTIKEQGVVRVQSLVDRGDTFRVNGEFTTRSVFDNKELANEKLKSILKELIEVL